MATFQEKIRELVSKMWQMRSKPRFQNEKPGPVASAQRPGNARDDAIDIVGPNPRSKKGSRYILIAMNYFNKWPEICANSNQEA